MSATNVQTSNLNTVRAGLNAALTAQSNTVSTNVNGINTKADGIRTDLTATQSSLSTLTRTVTATVQPAIATLQTQMTGVQTSAANIQVQITSTSTSLANSQALLGSVSNGLLNNLALNNAVSTSLVNSQNQISSLDGTVATTQGMRGAVSTTLSTTNVQISNTNNLLGATNGVIASVSNSLTSTNNLLGTVGTSQSTGTVNMAALLASNAALQAASTSLASRTSSMESQINCVLPGYAVDSTSGTCVPRNHHSRRGFMSDIRSFPAGWTDVSQRSFSFFKSSRSSTLLIEYIDVLGMSMTGNQNWGCRWRFCIDGCVWASRPVNTHTDANNGWRSKQKKFVCIYLPHVHIVNCFAVTPSGFMQYFDSIPTGTHTVTVQVYYVTSSSVRECLHGWSDGSIENSIVVCLLRSSW